MIIPTHYLDKFISNPRPFEELLNDLIRGLCATSPISIDWDERVNVPDGGRDIVVKEGSSNKKRRYLPTVSSIWSIKSGKDGLQSSV